MKEILFGKDVKKIRLDLGLSQTDFGKKAKASLRTVQNWEASKKPINHIATQRIRKLYEEYLSSKFSDFDTETYLKKMIETDTLSVLENIPIEKILGFIQLKERDFQVLPSYTSFIKSQMKTIELREIAKDI